MDPGAAHWAATVVTEAQGGPPGAPAPAAVPDWCVSRPGAPRRARAPDGTPF